MVLIWKLVKLDHKLEKLVVEFVIKFVAPMELMPPIVVKPIIIPFMVVIKIANLINTTFLGVIKLILKRFIKIIFIIVA